MKYTVKCVTYFLLIISYLFGCESKKSSVVSNGFLYEFTFDRISKPSFIDLVDDYYFVQLETNKESLIGSVEKVYIENEIIYILSDGGIYCFDVNGNFRNKISNQGKGPGEFISIMDFTIYSDRVIIYDQSLHKYILFDAFSSEFVKEFPENGSARNIAVINDTLFFDRSFLSNPSIDKDNDDMLVWCDMNNMSSLYGTLFSYENRPKYSSEHPLKYSNNNIYWVNSDFMDVYKWRNGFFIPYFSISGIEEYSKEEVFTLHKPSELRNLGIPFDLQDFYENDHFLVGKFLVESKYVTFIFDKYSNKYRCFTHTKGEFWEYSPVHFSGVSGNFFYNVFSNFNQIAIADLIKKSNIDRHLYSSKDLQNIDYILNVEEDANPCLMFYKFKSINGDEI